LQFGVLCKVVYFFSVEIGYNHASLLYLLTPPLVYNFIFNKKIKEKLRRKMEIAGDNIISSLLYSLIIDLTSNQKVTTIKGEYPLILVYVAYFERRIY
jgi:hypothetical protein